MKRIVLSLSLFVFGLSFAAASVYNVRDFGAKGDGVTDDAAAIQCAIDQCSQEGGGRVLLPRNHTFLSGPIELKSNVELYLEATATLKANPDESIYRLSAFGDNRGEGMLWLYADGAENLSITGRGTIHGNGIRFMGAELEDSYELKPLRTSHLSPLTSHLEEDPRPHVLTLTACNNLLIRDVTIALLCHQDWQREHGLYLQRTVRQLHHHWL